MGLWNHRGQVCHGSTQKRIWTLAFRCKAWFLLAISLCSPIRFEAIFRQEAIKRNRCWALPKKIPWTVFLGANLRLGSFLQSKGTPKQPLRWRVSMRSSARHRAGKSNREKNHRDIDSPMWGWCLCRTPEAGQWMRRVNPMRRWAKTIFESINFDSD